VIISFDLRFPDGFQIDVGRALASRITLRDKDRSASRCPGTIRTGARSSVT